MAQLPLPAQFTQGESPLQTTPDNFSVSQVPYSPNCVTSAPGLKVDTVAHLTVTNNNAFFLRQGTSVARSISGLASAQAFPALTGPDLAFDNGSQPPETPSCRCYTFFAVVDPVTSAVTLSVLYGADFPKHRAARTSDFNLGDGTKAIVGYLYVKNESSAVFTPGTTLLNVSGITARPSDQFGFNAINN